MNACHHVSPMRIHAPASCRPRQRVFLCNRMSMGCSKSRTRGALQKSQTINTYVPGVGDCLVPGKKSDPTSKRVSGGNGARGAWADALDGGVTGSGSKGLERSLVVDFGAWLRSARSWSLVSFALQRCCSSPPCDRMRPSGRARALYRAVEPSSGSNVIPKRARPGLAGLGPHRSRFLFRTTTLGSNPRTRRKGTL
jgi:hypothetical protein